MLKKISHFLFKYQTFSIQGFVFLLFLCISFWINKIPDGLFIAGGDFYQLIYPIDNFGRYFYMWFNQMGQGAFNPAAVTFPFYSLLAFLDYFGASSGSIAGFYIFFTLYFSYLSFYLSVKLFYPNLSENIRIGGSLVYALNNFTLTIFTYPWGFTHHFLFYVFAPVLIFTFLRILSEKNKSKVAKYFVVFVVVFILSVPAYTNFNFLILFFFTLFLLIIFFLLFKKIDFDKNLFVRLFALFAAIALLLLPFFVPFFIEHRDIQKTMFTSKTFGGDDYLNSWILTTSSNFLNSFLLAVDKHRFPLNKIDMSVFLSTFYFGFLLFFLVKTNIKKYEPRKTVWPFLIVLIILIFLSVRAYGPFKEAGLLIYKLPIFFVFRSPDKIFSIIPFVYAALLVGLISSSNFKKRLVYVVFGTFLIIPFPFYANGVYKELAKENSGVFSAESKYRYTVQIPKEYYEMQNVINSKNNISAIISLPYSVVNSISWSNYPKWHFLGHDILHLLYNKLFVSANVFDHPMMETRLSFKEFNESNEPADKLLNLIRKFSGQFIIFHKDIEPYWIGQSQNIENRVKELRNNGKIDLVTSNEYFDLYEVRKDYLAPLISSGANLYFQKVNPTKYKVFLNLKEKTSVVFHQSYNYQWKAYLKRNPNNSWCQKLVYYKQTKTTECNHIEKFFEGEELLYLYEKSIFDDTHIMIDDYANAWTIDPDYIKANYPKEYYKINSDGSMDIELALYFKSQSYFYIGLIMLGAILFCCLGYLIWDWRKKSKVYKVHKA